MIKDPRNWTAKYDNKSVRDNYLKAIEFRNPDWIPCSIGIFAAVWQKYQDGLTKLADKYPFIFGSYTHHWQVHRIPFHHKGNTYWEDNWGCGWQTAAEGFEGQVIKHPLADWKAFEQYHPPDPIKFTERNKRPPLVWFGSKIGMRGAKKLGLIASGGAERLFDRLYFLRGFDNLMRDFATNNPMLPKLVQMLQDHELRIIHKYIDNKPEYRPDIIHFHTDIGTQDRLMISPRQFRKYIKPMFTELFQTCRKAGTHVYLSSDGYLLDIVDDLKESGVSVHDPQERANTIEGIAKHYKGKLCVDLDLDRQCFPFITPDALKKQIKNAVDMLNLPEGGFMMKAEFSDANIPLENMEAVCQAFEEYCFPKR